MSLLKRYETIVSTGLLKSDPLQIQVLKKLQKYCDADDTTKQKRGYLNTITDKIFKTSTKDGMYLYGGVGSGKTMLMDLFYTSYPSPQKSRQHYNSFMLYVHSRLHELRVKRMADPVKIFANNFAKDYRVLCLDEFQVMDVADAMLLRNLLDNLLRGGLKLIVTSNRKPQDLYLNGIQRSSFLPCIDLIESKLEVVNLTVEEDFRKRSKETSMVKLFYYPITTETTCRVCEIIRQLSNGEQMFQKTIYTHGRPIHIKECNEKIAVFHFNDLCERSLSAADFICIASNFEIIAILGVPELSNVGFNVIRRFITLVDILYDNKIKLLMQLALPVNEIFRSIVGNANEEVFASERTISRLCEMEHLSWWSNYDHSLNNAPLEK